MESITLEPDWEGMRTWVRNVAKTDLDNAHNINNAMGTESIPSTEIDKIWNEFNKESNEDRTV